MKFETFDSNITVWMSNHGPTLLRISLGIVFFWFGFLKFFPGASSAEELAVKTIGVLTFGAVPLDAARMVLAAWESVIGLGLIFGVFQRTVLLLLFVQMIGTFSPLVLFPDESFSRIPFVPTLEGQYIIKNLVLISAGLTLGAMVRGGAVVADPREAKQAKENEGRNLNSESPR